jgi:hypothetical protein
MSHTEADYADAQSTEAFELGGRDQVFVSVKPQQSKCAWAQDAYHRPAPGIVDPPDGLGAHIRRRGRSKSRQSGPLLAHIVDDLDSCVGSQFVQQNAIDGIVGVEDYSTAPLPIIDP